MSALDVVCLDVGEVIVDETRVWSTWASMLDVTPFTLMARIGAALAAGTSYTTALDSLAARRGLEWRDLIHEHEERLGPLREEDLHPDARTATSALRSLGLQVVLAGNQPARRTPELHDLDLDVDDITTSDELGAEKPDPAFFARLLERLGDPDPAHVVYVGDRVDNDVRPARDAGLRPIWLHRGPWALLTHEADDSAPAARDLDHVTDIVRGWLADDVPTEGERHG